MSEIICRIMYIVEQNGNQAASVAKKSEGGERTAGREKGKRSRFVCKRHFCIC